MIGYLEFTESVVDAKDDVYNMYMCSLFHIR